MNMIKERKTNSVRVMRSLYITGVAMVLTQLVLFLQFKSSESASTIAKPGCQDSCGGIPIPYPFGIGLNCSLSQVFNVTCDTTYNNSTPTPSLGGNFPIWNIILSLGQARVGTLVSSKCYNTMTKKVDRNIWGFRLGDTYWVNNEKNKFILIGCNTLAFLTMQMKDNSNYSVGCLSSCDSLDTLNKYGSCSGIGCCQTAISKQTIRLSVKFEKRYNISEVYNFSRCSYAMVVEETHFKFDTTYITTDWLSSSQKKGYPFYSSTLPMVLNWAIGNMACDIAQKDKSSYACKSSNSVCLNSTRGYGGYICNCSDGYQGNPYLNEGCQDIDDCANPNACTKPGKCHNIEGGHRCSCPFGWRSNHNNPIECDLNGALLIGIAAGIVALLIVGFGIYVVLERRNLSKVKHKHFEQHGGWILLEKMKSNHGFSFTIFTKQQLEQATNNFDSANILGHGGHGTVYRGTLRDETVAIKKCKIVNESKKQEFGKEMLILSQINC